MQKLILLDVDGTIVDDSFNLDLPELISLIQYLIHLGWVIGLNSDRDYQLLRMVHSKLGLNGPIISEGGAVIHEKKPKWKVTYKARTSVIKFKELAIQFLAKVRRKKPSLQILITDTLAGTQMLQQSNTTTGTESSRSWLILNPFRQASCSFVVVDKKRNKIRGNAQLLIQLATIVSDLFPPIFQEKPAISLDKKDGVCIVHLKQTSKASAVPFFFSRELGHIIMIGNTMADHLDSHRVIQLAVGNAEDDYKDRCQFVSELPLAQGVMQCLEWTARNLG